MTTETLGEALDHARASAESLIDDPQDLESRVVMRWLRKHGSFREGKHQWVFVAEPLPPLWQPRAKPFLSAGQAEVFLRKAAHDHFAMTAMREIAQRRGSQPIPPPDADTIKAVASLLVSRNLWILPLRNGMTPHGKTDPSVYQKLNGANGSQVDFAYLGRWEGGQYLHGYVPIDDKSGKVAGKSGMTIATGFDIGQKTRSELKKLHLADDLYKRLEHYADLRFPGKTHAEVAKLVAGHGPVPAVSKEEADAIDLAVHGQHLKAAVAAWNTRRADGVPAFGELPTGWQTVLFSRTFHQGVGMPDSKQAKKFYTAATQGKWQEAVTALRNYPVKEDWYKKRVGAEADLLQKALPAPVKGATAAPGASGPAAPGPLPMPPHP